MDITTSEVNERTYYVKSNEMEDKGRPKSARFYNPELRLAVSLSCILMDPFIIDSLTWNMIASLPETSAFIFFFHQGPFVELLQAGRRVQISSKWTIRRWWTRREINWTHIVRAGKAVNGFVSFEPAA
jgi:hypothetical protein